ncbi:MAG: sigma-54 dependent transcriptional regulator [Verrucomicrobiae bacterium]|nr:sigma-54 dependent transcriptional regulator [Verrucomicrobiae bacterium]
MAKANIIVVDTDISWTLLASEMLVKGDYEVFTANRAADALVLLEARRADAAIVELNLPDSDPISFFEQVTQRHPSMAVIMCTARPTIEQAFELGRRGATQYLTKSITPDCLQALRLAAAEVEQRPALEQRATAPPPARGRGLLMPTVPGFYGIISQDPQMEDIFELIRTIADSTANVLICGETGTGKELVARAIHEASNRHGKPFVAMDCSALAHKLLESELFGHEKGALTGAHVRRIGRFERANGGTPFLDELGNMDPAIQAKLLRVIQTRTFERVGGQQSISVDVRIVAATNTPLEELVAQGRFREDLYHRLNVVEIALPPLRERGDDVVLLAREFMRRFAQKTARMCGILPKRRFN